MPRKSSSFICQQCGYQSPTYLGRCPECNSWGSLVETIQAGLVRGVAKTRSHTPVTIQHLSEIENRDFDRIKTGLSELDRVLGGGIVRGSVVLVAGDPGIGKSTLLTQLAIKIDESKESNETNEPKDRQPSTLSTPSIPATPSVPSIPGVLYVAGEESARQIKIRVDRIKRGANLAVLNEVDVDLINEAVISNHPELVIVDSIQTLQTEDLQSVAGSVGQVRECAHRLQRVAKDLHIPVILVGHVTKEGTVAGPKTLEHLVDAVLSLEGEPQSQFRILRSTKNRFGPTDEVGIFEMEEGGMVEVKNPSKIFLDTQVNAPGAAVAATAAGFRPMLVEVQALVTKTQSPMPRRVATGIDPNRLQLLVAVLAKRLNLPLFDKDIFVNVVGGIKVNEPAIDLAVCLAVISSLKDKALKPKTALVGEVGLLGELRPIRQEEKRAKEAERLGFTNVVTPKNAKTLEQALKLALL